MSKIEEIFIPENSHILTTFQIKDDDSYHTKSIKFMSGKEANFVTRYPFRSQGNIHIVIAGEQENSYQIISFDGHKGDIYVNENSTIDVLKEKLNEKEGLRPFNEETEISDIETAICYLLKFKI